MSSFWIQFVNVTGVAIGNGFATAADTLCSQVGKLPDNNKGQNLNSRLFAHFLMSNIC